MNQTRATVLILLLSLAALAPRCNRSEALARADDILISLRAAQPLIAELLPRSTTEINQAVTIAEKLKAAVAQSDAASTLQLLSDLVPVFQQIVEQDVPQIHSTESRVKILAALALADVSLHFLARQFVQADASGAMRVAGKTSDTLRVFNRQAVWGDRFKR